MRVRGSTVMRMGGTALAVLLASCSKPAAPDVPAAPAASASAASEAVTQTRTHPQLMASLRKAASTGAGQKQLERDMDLALSLRDRFKKAQLTYFWRHGRLERELFREPRFSQEELDRLHQLVKRSIEETGRVIGDDTRSPYDGRNHAQLEPVARATGFIKGDTCTATYLGDRLAVTAGHCLSIAAYEEIRDAPCDFEIEWRKTQAHGPSTTSRCERILAARFDYYPNASRGPDYLIMRLADGPLPPPLERPRCPRPPIPGAKLAALSYPDAGPLTTSGPCMVRATPPGLALKGGMIVHDCDTESGSSGAGLVDATSLCLVAIHNGGTDRWQKSQGDPKDLNFATLVSQTPLSTWLPEGEGHE